MREKPNYRPNLERVIEHFGDVGQMPIKDVAMWLKMDVRTAIKELGKKKGGRYYVTQVDLANWLS